MKLQAFSSPEELLDKADVLCIPAARDQAEFIYQHVLLKVIHPDALPPLQDFIAGKAAPAVFFGQKNNHRIKVIYWCEGDTLTAASAYTLVKKLAMRAKNDTPGIPGIVTHHLKNAELIRSAFAGWVAGQYDLGMYKHPDNGSAKQNQNNGADILTCLPADIDPDIAKSGMTVGHVQQEVMNLVNTPSSHKSPSNVGAWASRSAAQYGYEVEVLDKNQLTSLGMHAVLAVNRGSEHPAQLVVSHYKHPEATKKIAIIGKGVLFDTGGISIKDSKNLHYMKSDMAGAATALGTVEACARLKMKVDVIAITPLTDNSVDGTSIKPGDVISSYLGKTIEVIDTDAEGRLILADALAYAIKEHNPDVMIDLATLTGSIVAALGPQAAGLFSKNDQLADALLNAGNSTGERVWRMPMYDEYHEDMQSDIADIKNLSEKPYAGSITAAKFLEYFTSEHNAWAHLDIAGMAFQPNGFGKGYCAVL